MGKPENKSKNYSTYSWLAFYAILAILVRLFVASMETEVGVDSVHYILMGDNIAHGRGFDTWNTTGGTWTLPPTFPILIALFIKLGANLEWAGHLASVFAGTTVLFPVYFQTKRLFGGLAATASATITIFTPILVDYSAVILTELLFASCVLYMILFALRAFSEKGTITDSLISGFFCGLGYLTKTFGIFTLPFLLAGFLFSRGGKSNLPPIKQTGISLLGFLILAVPYWIFLFNYYGEFVLDGKGIGQENRIWARNLNEEHRDPRYSGELTSDGSDFEINVYPHGEKPEWASTGWLISNFPKKYVQKLIRIYQDFPSTPTYPNNVLPLYLLPIILFGLGLFTGKERWKDFHARRFAVYWLCPFIFGLPIIFVEVRYYVPVVALLVPLMSLGAVVLSDWISNSFERIDSRQGFAIVMVLYMLIALPKIMYKYTHRDDPFVSYNPREVAAEWLTSNIDVPGNIMEYGHSVSFYAGAQSILIPDGDLNDVIRIARKYDAPLLSLDEFYLLRANRRPQLNYLFDTEIDPPDGLVRIYTDERYPGLKHVIYLIEDVGDYDMDSSEER